jgi:hypothetical protein
MFYILVAIWFVVCFVRCFINPEMRNAFLKLVVATVMVCLIILWLGSPKVAGLVLGFGLIPPALRLASTQIRKFSS